MPPRLTAPRAVYFLHYAAVGLMVPFFGPYLESRGLGGPAQGTLFALRMAVSILAAPLFGLAADRFGAHRALQAAAALAAVACALVLAGSTFLALAAVSALLGAGLSLLAPLNDAATLGLLESHVAGRDLFGRTRLYGSIGFAAAAFLFGIAFSGADPAHTSRMAMAGMALLSVAALAAALAMPAVPSAHEARPRLSDLARLLRVRGIPQVLAAGALQWICLSPYHGFFGEHVEHHGGGSFVVGASIAVAVAVEVLVMATAPRWLPRTTRRHVMAVSALAGVLRFSVTACGSPGWIIAAQALHGLSYGAFYLAMVDAVARRAPPELRATAQALIASLAVGIGTLLGNVPAGALFGIDSGRTLFLAAAAFSVVPAIASLAIPPP